MRYSLIKYILSLNRLSEVPTHQKNKNKYMLKLITISDSLSKSFDSHIEDEKIKSTRMFSILAIVLLITSSFIDIWAFPSILFEINTVRSLLMIAFGLIFWSTFSPFFINNSNKIQHLMCFMPTIGIMFLMSISSPTDTGHNIYFGFLILITMVLFAWTHIPLREMVMHVAVTIVAYSASIYEGNHIEYSVYLDELIPSVYVMVGALCTGFVGRSINENHLRQNFLYSQTLKELAEKQSHIANHDDLTGLSNRRSSEKLLQQDLSYAIKHNVSHFVMLLDLNFFKTINDVHGHQAGDAVLEVVAKRLNSCTRKEDHVCRIGGDEFAISLVVEKNKTDFIAKLQDKIKDSVTQPIKVGSKMLHVGISIGVASFPDDGSNSKVLLGIADDRMYQDKLMQKESNEVGHSRSTSTTVKTMQSV